MKFQRGAAAVSTCGFLYVEAWRPMVTRACSRRAARPTYPWVTPGPAGPGRRKGFKVPTAVSSAHQ